MRQLPGREAEEATFPKGGAKEALELVHGDLYGPITPATCGGRQYFLLLVDDYSRYMWLQLLTSKDEAVAAIKKFKMRAEVESGKKLRVLRTDRDDEFTSVEFAAYCADQGVGQHHTTRTRHNRMAWWSDGTRRWSAWLDP